MVNTKRPELKIEERAAVELDNQPKVERAENKEKFDLNLDFSFERDNLGTETGMSEAPATRPEKTSVVNMPVVIDEQYKKIETILEEDLREIYFSMTPEQRTQFKVKGEETTIAILDLLAKPKIKAKKILALIINWLKMIPGINHFFLEQEAKIKTDKILNMVKKKNHD